MPLSLDPFYPSLLSTLLLVHFLEFAVRIKGKIPVFVALYAVFKFICSDLLESKTVDITS